MIMEQIRLRFCTPLQLLRAAQSSRNGDREMAAARHVACSLAQLLLAQRSARLAARSAAAARALPHDGDPSLVLSRESCASAASARDVEPELDEITLLAARHGLVFTRGEFLFTVTF